MQTDAEGPSARGRVRRTAGKTSNGATPGTAGLDERQLLRVLTSLKEGDFSARLPLEWTGMAGKIADTLNDVIALNQRMAEELERLSRLVGKEGKLTQRAGQGGCRGSWAASTECVDWMIDELVVSGS